MSAFNLKGKHSSSSPPKAIIKIALVLLVIGAIVIGLRPDSSMAYFTDTKSENNSFVFGKGVDIIPNEPNYTERTTPYTPNAEVQKDPQVANNGSEDCIVFMQISVPVESFTLVNDNGTKGETSETEIFWLKSSDAPAGEHKNSFNDTDNGGNWVLLDYTAGSAGSYSTYLFGYQKVLPPSSTSITNVLDKTEIAKLDSHTDPVFDKVQLKNYLEGTLRGNYKILVNAYAIQAQYLEGSSGNDLTGNLYENDKLISTAVISEAVLHEIWNTYGAQMK